VQEFGWSEGRNIRFDYRFTRESTERMRTAAAELVALAPDVIFVSTNPVVSAVRQVTQTIPIVFTWVSDSVGSGYVSSLAHPGGNIKHSVRFSSERALAAQRRHASTNLRSSSAEPSYRQVTSVHRPWSS
jgi:putative ABC transport system substrate-binding protein